MRRRYKDKLKLDSSLPPQLILSYNVKDFYEMTIDDFEMTGYKPIKPQLVLELGI
jgi:thymidylate synthase